MPWPSGSDLRYIRPRDCSSGVTASSTAKVCTPLLLAISSVCSSAAPSLEASADGNASKHKVAKRTTQERRTRSLMELASIGCPGMNDIRLAERTVESITPRADRTIPDRLQKLKVRGAKPATKAEIVGLASATPERRGRLGGPPRLPSSPSGGVRSGPAQTARDAIRQGRPAAAFPYARKYRACRHRA